MNQEYAALTEREAAAMLAAATPASPLRADIVTHASPDADTLGCALALYSIINENGGDAAVVGTDPVPEYLRFLTEGVLISDSLREDAVRIAVDVASPPQLGKFQNDAGTFSLMIDHHGRGEAFADNVIEADAAACGEIIFRLAEILKTEFGMKVPLAAYSYIYAAISGDTGSFRFANTTAVTHRIAAELHEKGVDTVTIAHNLHAVKTRGEIAAKKIGFSNMKLLCKGKLAVTSASLSELKEAGVASGDFSLADEMRSVMGVYVGVSLKENEPGVWRVSTRANVGIDCAAVAAKFGGGGHKGAAGCTLCGYDRVSALDAIVDEFAAAIEEFELDEK